MATILTGNGRRRCDGVCHKAAGSKCGCICGGKFHGSALNRPAELAAEVAKLPVSAPIKQTEPEEEPPLCALMKGA